MKKIQIDVNLELQIIVTGMHLSPEFGLTYKQIEKDGFIITEKIEMLLSSDTPSGIAKSIGLGTIGFSDAFQRLEPNLLVVLGDRFEVLSAVQTAMIFRIPVAHIHGGELTEGLIDDPIRHSITKMSHIHLAATEEYRERIIQMGEQPTTVYNVGALGVEGIRETPLLSKEELSSSLDIDLDKFFLVTLHPTTLEMNTAKEQIEILLNTLDEFKEHQLIFTKTNADTDGRIINLCIEDYVSKHRDKARVFDSLGQVRYLSSLKYCDAVIGNSSSGLLEAPIFIKPTVNIGNRQKGRLKTESVIDCAFDKTAIMKAVQLGLSTGFNERIQKMPPTYGAGNTSERMLEIIKETNLQNILIKEFNDIKRSI